MVSLLIASMAVMTGTAELPAWTFDSEADARAWVASGQLRNAAVRDGVLHAEAQGTDPFFSCHGLSIPATPWQYVVIRMKASRSGTGDLFWSGVEEGEYGGLTEEKKTSFKVPGDSAWQEIVLFPFWHPEKTIRQLRLDVYDDATFDIDSIRVLTWGGGEGGATKGVYAWQFNGDVSPWRITPSARELFAPPLDLDVSQKGWVTLRLQSSREGVVSILWGSKESAGMHSEEVAIQGDAAVRTYNVELQGIPAWSKGIAAFGIRLPDEGAGVRLESIKIVDLPSGPADLAVSYFGFENGVNRAGRPCRVLAQLINRGGSPSGPIRGRLTLPEGLRLIEGKEDPQGESIPFGEQTSLFWTVLAEKAGQYPVRLTLEGDAPAQPEQAVLRFSVAPDVAKADYVPEPKPVATDIDVCAYYFPGWNSDAKWDPIRRVAPVRKPLLGYYDEGNPECVDWQIKWAVENGISCFLVDWYWTSGQQMLTHWLEAYQNARYRDQLKIAIMWANHNPPGTHSVEDWRAVTRYWIDHYFGLKSYYRIDGKPAVFIWDPNNILTDLKDSKVVRGAFDDSQAMARAAGYAGITFVAMSHHGSTALAAARLAEGYAAATTYHEWGKAPDMGPDPKRARFEDLVATVPAAWAANDASHGKLTYYPVVDTGWDARPWHGSKSLVIEGRTTALFEQLLRKAKDYCGKTGKRIVVLGPLNEWGEGSYIEPNTEYGFDMYEAVRSVFAKGDPAAWPVNLAPADVGRGPYDFAVRPTKSLWTFDQAPEGWTAMMNVGKLLCKDGALRMQTTSGDPALVVDLANVTAEKYARAVIRMQITGAMPAGKKAQLFWSQGGSAMSEATSARFTLENDGQPHTYTLDLKSNPRWRGKITSLRFDPCETKGVEVVLDQFELTP